MEERRLRDETIGERLLRLRRERGLSQLDISGPGVSTAHISRIETGKRAPSVKAIRLLARKLQVSPQYLETGSDVGSAEKLEMRLSEAELQLRFNESPEAAVTALEDVLAEAIRAGETELAARALVGLGFAAAAQNQAQEAADQLERAISLGCVRPATHPDVFVTLGRMYWLLDDYERFAGLMEGCLEQLEDQPREETAIARTTFMTYLSYAFSCQGDFERAHELLEQVSEEQEQAMDPYARARLLWSHARLSKMEGKPQVALKYLRRSIALLESTEDNLHQARAHQLCAQAFNLESRPDEAMKHLALAEELLGARIDPTDLGLIRTEQAKSLAILGRAQDALARAEEAERLLEKDPDDLGSAWYALARAYEVGGDTGTALDYYERATERLSANRGEWREAVQACHDWARLLGGLGRAAEAASVSARADEIERQATARPARVDT
jgi:tetratricopeptide (TPR) repeat protein